MKAVYGLYRDGQAAQQAVNRLRAAGIADRDITVISAQPMEDYEFGHMDKATWMWWLACLGGLVGMSVGFRLTWLTETAWPMDVGGLPIYAWWPNLIIIFELTMLGAIIATVATLVVSALLPTRGRALYDPEVTDGNILVGVESPSPTSVSDLEMALSAPPGARVKTL
jgi:Alternative complex III, ActD subunit